MTPQHNATRNSRHVSGSQPLLMKLTARHLTSQLAACAVATVLFVATIASAEESVKEDARKAGRAAGSAAREVWQGAKKAGKEVGHEAKKAGQAVGGAAKEGAQEFKRALKGEK